MDIKVLVVLFLLAGYVSAYDASNYTNYQNLSVNWTGSSALHSFNLTLWNTTPYTTLRITSNGSGTETECAGWWYLKNESNGRIIVNCTLATGNNLIRVYYNNLSGMSDLSNITLACGFGDDFDTKALDTVKWTNLGGFTYTQGASLGNISNQGGYSGITSRINFSIASQVFYYCKNNANGTYLAGWSTNTSGGYATDAVMTYRPGAGTVWANEIYVTGGNTRGSTNATKSNNWGLWEHTWEASNATIRLNNTYYQGYVSTTPAGPLPVSIRSGAGTTSCDWICAGDDFTNASVSAWSGEYNVSSTPAATPVTVTISSPTNTTYIQYYIPVSVTCAGNEAAYLLNISENGIVVQSNIAVLNNTAFGFSDTFPSNGGWNLSATCLNGTDIASNNVNFTVNATPISPTYNQFYGYDSGNMTSNYSSYVSTYGYNLYGSTLTYSNFSGEWPAFKTASADLFSNISVASFLTFSDKQATYTNATAECANINTNFTDLKLSPYLEAVQFILIDYNTTASGGNTSGFINNVSQCILNATSNLIPVYAKYPVGGINPDYVANWSMPYLVDQTNLTLTTESEKGFMRNTSNVVRIYSGTNATFLTWAKTFHQSIINPLRAMPTGSPATSDTQIALLANGDFIVYNNASTAQVLYVNNSALTNNTDLWDYTHSTLNKTVDRGLNLSISMEAQSAALIYADNYSYISINSSNISTLMGASTSSVSNMNFSSPHTTDGSFSVVGSYDIRGEVWDPTFGYYNQEFHTYEQLEYTQMMNFSPYSLIVISRSDTTNSVGTVNITLRINDSDASGILNRTYGYISVADYNNSKADGSNETNCSIINPWETTKEAEADIWTQNYSMNVFIDGFDIGFSSVPACFEQRIKRVADHIRLTRKKKTIFNTYTIYQTVAHYGDRVMRESCFSRWDGTVSSPTYSYENFTLMVQNANYLTGISKPVVCMAFGDVNDYDKLAYDYHAFAVLYGADGNNTFRYAQPNFQVQREIRTPNFGSMLQIGYTNTSATDWQRRYSNGIVHFNPYRNSTYSNGKYYWFENQQQIQNANITATYQIYGSTCNSSANLYLTVMTANANTTYTILACDVGALQWASKTITTNITATYDDSGHYYIWIYPADRTNPTGLNVYNSLNTQSGVHSWYASGVTHPPDEASWTSYGRSGTIGDFNTTNWDLNITMAKNSTAVAISGLTDIVLVDSALGNGRNISINSTKSYPITVYTPAVYEANPYLNGITYAGTPLNYTLTSDCNSSYPTFTSNNVAGLTHGVCRQASGTGYIYRFSAPSLSEREYLLSFENLSVTISAPTGNISDFSVLYNFTCNLNASATFSGDIYAGATRVGNFSGCANNTPCTTSLSTAPCGNHTLIVNCTSDLGISNNGTGNFWAVPNISFISPANNSNVSYLSNVSFQAYTTCLGATHFFTANGTNYSSSADTYFNGTAKFNDTGSIFWNATIVDAAGVSYTTASNFVLGLISSLLTFLPEASLAFGTAAYIAYVMQIRRAGGRR